MIHAKSARDLAMALVLLVCFSQVAAFDTIQQTDNRYRFVLTNDNDSLALLSTDRLYTNGIRLTMTHNSANQAPIWLQTLGQWLPWFPSHQPTRHAYTIGQSMFTPEDMSQSEFLPDDRLYAGWLYVTTDLSSINDNKFDIFSLTLGIVGPDSQAEASQKGIHQLIGAEDPKGWNNQLDNAVGFNLAYQRSWRVFKVQRNHHSLFDLTPYVSGALGSIYRYAGTGINLRFGPNLMDEYGLPKFQFGLPITNLLALSRSKHFNWYGFSGIEVRYVEHNYFLKGNSALTRQSQIQPNPWIGQFQVGVVFDWSRFSLTLNQMLQTKEYTTQTQAHNIGTLSFSIKY
ncbi:lipid A deacylase LpxR family protein [Thiomicrospira microaerophila]|uniref:lipid A deacylase LpxR family protein n=1 Tax=Thiomicrospira microaerophila TaxID=406020 RepID=UPI00200BD66B|nr:lipid A deacylase LpxR family protein [Thiomicrospira microaerophila]UQB42882.1 lipid A deacylase LpxR family protein [Thiomicrospira microaerophila]